MKKLLTIILWLSATQFGHAGLEEGLNKFFDEFGVSSNITGPSTNQSAGYYSGGSLMARGKAKNYQLLSVQPPSFKVGCGGIDLFMGGISHISGEDIKRMATEIGQGAAFFAMSIALQTLTPQIKSVTDQIMSIARDVNNMNINTCQASAALVGSLWPKTEASSQVLCRSLGLGSGPSNGFTDYAAARQKCGNSATRNDVVSKMHENPQFADQLGEEFNLAWKALGKTSMLKPEKEWFMSISGSIIASKPTEGEDSDKGIAIARLPSLAKSEDWLKGMLDGNGNGTLSVYRCGSDDKCLHPTVTEVRNYQPFLDKIGQNTRSISQKVGSGEELTDPEKKLIGSTNIPILKIMAVERAFARGNAPVSVVTYDEIIATDIVLKYLETVVNAVEKSVAHLASVQMSSHQIDEFHTDLRRVKDLIFRRRNGLFNHLNETLSAIERTRQVEQQLYSLFAQASAK